MERGSRWATFHGVAELDTTEHAGAPKVRQCNCSAATAARKNLVQIFQSSFNYAIYLLRGFQ